MRVASRVPLVVCGLAVRLLAPSAAQADEPPAPLSPRASPQGSGAFEPTVRYPPSSVRPKLVVGGLAIAGLAYGAGYLVASTSTPPPGAANGLFVVGSMNALKVPVAGPWMALSEDVCITTSTPTATTTTTQFNCDGWRYFRGVMLVLEGLVQLGGLGVAGEGLFMTTESGAPAAKASAFFEWRGREGLSVSPAPLLGGRMTGLGFKGTF